MSDQRICTSCTNLDTLPPALRARPSRARSASQRPRCSLADARRSVAGELAVCDGVRPSRLGAEPLDLVLLVGVEVPLEPEPFGRVLVVALPRQDVRGDPVEEPAVVAGDNRASREVEQRVLE